MIFKKSHNLAQISVLRHGIDYHTIFDIYFLSGDGSTNNPDKNHFMMDKLKF